MSGQDDLLKEEYFHLQDTVEDFDQKALTIKAWSVTLSMAGFGVAFTKSAPSILLLAALASLLFWVTEALWKSFQRAYYSRIDEIEHFYAGKLDTIKPFQIHTRWSPTWLKHRWRKLWRTLWYPHVWLPHLFVVLGGFGIRVANRWWHQFIH